MTREKNPITTAQAVEALRAEAQTGLRLDAQTRLAARLQTAVVAGDIFSAAASIGSQAPVTAGAALPAEPKASAVDWLSALLASHPIASLVTTLAVGAVVGASVHAITTSHASTQRDGAPSLARTAASTSRAAAAFVNDAPVASIDDLPLIAARESGARAPGARRTKPIPVGPASSGLPTASASMAEQLALLERARAALGRGDGNAALRMLDEHAREYPTSALSEEREALTIMALARAGQLEQAKARLTQFEARSPGSLMLSALKRAVGGGAATPTPLNSENP